MLRPPPQRRARRARGRARVAHRRSTAPAPTSSSPTTRPGRPMWLGDEPRPRARSRALYAQAAPASPRRGQQPGARLARRRRRLPALPGARRGRLRLTTPTATVRRLCRLLGAADPRPRAPGGGRGAWREAAARGTSFGAPTELEVELAERDQGALPCSSCCASSRRAPKRRCRPARGARVHRPGHGHQVRRRLSRPRPTRCSSQAGSGVATLGIPASPACRRRPRPTRSLLPFNDLAAVRAAFERHAARSPR